jgi:hypothetical protein
VAPNVLVLRHVLSHQIPPRQRPCQTVVVRANLLRSSCNNPFVSQLRNLTALHPQQPRQHLVRVLAQRRRRAPYARLALTVLDRRTDQPDRTAFRMLNLRHHAPRLHMRMVQCIHDIVDGRVRHAGPLEQIQPLPGGSRPRDLLDEALQFDAVGDARVVGGESLVGFPGRSVEPVAEDAEEAIVAAADQDVAVEGAETFVGDDGGMSGAPSAHVALSRDEDRARHICKRRDLAIAEGDVKMLSLTCSASRDEAGHNGVAGVESCREVGHGDADLDGWAVSFAGDVHEAHFGFDHDVVTGTGGIGSILAIAGDRGVD